MHLYFFILNFIGVYADKLFKQAGVLERILSPHFITFEGEKTTKVTLIFQLAIESKSFLAYSWINYCRP